MGSATQTTTTVTPMHTARERGRWVLVGLVGVVLSLVMTSCRTARTDVMVDDAYPPPTTAVAETVAEPLAEPVVEPTAAGVDVVATNPQALIGSILTKEGPVLQVQVDGAAQPTTWRYVDGWLIEPGRDEYHVVYVESEAGRRALLLVGDASPNLSAAGNVRVVHDVQVLPVFDADTVLLTPGDCGAEDGRTREPELVGVGGNAPFKVVPTRLWRADQSERRFLEASTSGLVCVSGDDGNGGDRCATPFEAPDQEPLVADLDADGVKDLIWLVDRTLVARLGDGRSLVSRQSRDLGQPSLELFSSFSTEGPRTVVVNLDDEPGDEFLINMQMNNWWGAVVVDLGDCALVSVPSEIGGDRSVQPLPLGTSSASCMGHCTYTLRCVPGVGLHLTQGFPTDGIDYDEETGEVERDAPMDWQTTLWTLQDGVLTPTDEASGTATVADIGRIPELQHRIDC